MVGWLLFTRKPTSRGTSVVCSMRTHNQQGLQSWRKPATQLLPAMCMACQLRDVAIVSFVTRPLALLYLGEYIR